MTPMEQAFANRQSGNTTAIPGATVWFEQETYFAGIDYGEVGVLVLGYGATSHEAITKMIDSHNG